MLEIYRGKIVTKLVELTVLNLCEGWRFLKDAALFLFVTALELSCDCFEKWHSKKGTACLHENLN